MHSFLKKLLLGVLCACALFASIMVVRSVVVWPGLREAFCLPEGTRVLFSGDSHIGCSIVKSPGVSVLWRSATSPKFTLLRLRNVARMGWPKSLRIVVTEVGAQTLYAEHLELRSGSGWERLERHPWWFGQAWPPLGVLWFRAREVFSLRTPTPIVETPPATDISFTERTAEEQASNLRIAFDNHTRQAMTPAERARVEQAVREELMALRAFCAAQGARLVLFSAPLSSYYRARASKQTTKAFEELQTWLRAEGFEYYDCRLMMEDVWFRDSHHLRPSGAKRFTEVFLRMLR